MIDSNLKKKVEDLKQGNILLAIRKHQKQQEDQKLSAKIIELMKADGKDLENLDDMIPYVKLAEKAIKEEDKTKPRAPTRYGTGGLKLDNYIDNVEEFYRINPFFYDQNQIFWLWNSRESKYELADDVTMMNLIDQELGFGGQTVTGSIKSAYLESFKRVGRMHLPKDAPKHWVQFRDEIIDLKEQKVFEASSEYFICNPIPWKIGESEDTPVMDKLFIDWVGAEHKESLYEILAYCIIADYPIHTLFALVGCGRNGKSKYLNLIELFVGQKNIVSTELDDLIDSRFEKAKLLKKLVCVMGETNFSVMNKTSLIKKLTGQDLIGMEFKGKNPFDTHNYAKIIISSNSLPMSTDTSEGFYRRWMIIEFNNIFPEGKDILGTIPEVEYENLARKSIKILTKILNQTKFTHQGSIDQRRQSYIKASNPFSLFLEECCEVGESYFVKAKDLYSAYIKYLLQHKKRVVKKKEYNQILSEEGFYPDKKSKEINGEWDNTYWVEGLRLKSSLSLGLLGQLGQDSKSESYIGFGVENTSQKSQLSQSQKSQDDNLSLWEHLEGILLDRPNNEIEIESLLEKGFSEAQIGKWRSEGKLVEIFSGRVRLL